MIILNLTKNSTIASNARLADNFISRMAGLLGKSRLSAEDALIITRCRSIHMFFMRFAIDVIFVDKQYNVVGIVKNIQPNRLSPFFPKAFFAVEALPGTIEKSATSIGDQLFFQI